LRAASTRQCTMVAQARFSSCCDHWRSLVGHGGLLPLRLRGRLLCRQPSQAMLPAAKQCLDRMGLDPQLSIPGEVSVGPTPQRPWRRPPSGMLCALRMQHPWLSAAPCVKFSIRPASKATGEAVATWSASPGMHQCQRDTRRGLLVNLNTNSFCGQGLFCGQQSAGSPTESHLPFSHCVFTIVQALD